MTSNFFRPTGNFLVLTILLVLFVSCGNETDENVKIETSQAKNMKISERVFYNIFVRSFFDSNGDGIGDLNGITQKLDYLKSLGVSGLWLSPIHPSNSYHKYDVQDYREIDRDFGTLADFKNLLAEAKKETSSFYSI